MPRGTSLAGLLLGRMLGQGGFGITYLAWDPQLAAWRVVKEFFPRDLVLREPADGRTVVVESPGAIRDYQSALERFVDEARTLAQLEHNHVVRVTQYLQAHNTGYFVMPFLPGETVQARHAARVAEAARRGADPEGALTLWELGEVAALLRPLADALEFLHSRTPPVLHRDLKPDNLYLVREGGRTGDRLLVLDFGAAREDIGRSKLSRTYTPGFAPPEQVAGLRQSSATDAYAAAATVYYLLTNRRPGVAPHVVPPRRLVGDRIPLEVERAILAGLHERPDQRPPVGALWDVIERNVQGSGARARDRARAKGGALLPRTAVMAGTAVAIALSGWLFFSGWKAWRERPGGALADATSLGHGSSGQPRTPDGKDGLGAVPDTAVNEPDARGNTADPAGTKPDIGGQTGATGGGGTSAELSRLLGEGQFVLIPAGNFNMGGNELPEEQPLRTVSITKPFRLQRTEVTQRQWQRVMGNNPSRFRACGPTCPVENVSWQDVQEFLARLNRDDPGKGYRLPTEAEWEYAARAGAPHEQEFGGTGVATEMGWVLQNSEERSHPVGGRQPNAWGLRDMHGNVWEWVQDWWDERYYARGEATDPQGPPSGRYHVLRGGSWAYDEAYARSAKRFFGGAMLRKGDVGFRLARDP